MTSPAGVITEFWRWFWVGILGLALLAALILGGWRAGWWFADQNANRQAQLIQNGYSNQSTLRSQLTQQIANVDQITSQLAASPDSSDVSALKAQRAAIAAIACQDASQITGSMLPAVQRGWVTSNCLAGTVRPGSSYYQTGTP